MDPLKISLSQMSRAISVPEARLTHWFDPLRRAMVVADITTHGRAASFLANVSHETGYLRRFVENLNYSAQRLTVVWPSRFPTLASTEGYANNPQALANKVYGGRMGNGDEASGDGWRFRGRGPFMLTGRDNYDVMTDVLAVMGVFVDLEAHPDTVAEPENGSYAAAAFWRHNNLNTVMDTQGADAVRKKINGGNIGLAETRALFQGALQVLREVP